MKRGYTRKFLIFGLVGLVLLSAGIVFIFLSHVGVFHGGNFGNSRGQSVLYSQPRKFAELIRPGILYPVVHVMDGDTLMADVEGHTVTVRLIGIDTPETVDPRKQVECFGPQASAEAKRIFGTGTGTSTVRIYLEKDAAVGDYDKYGRILAYVSLPPGGDFPDGLNYNEYMLRKGFAREYTYMHQRYKYQSDFTSLEAGARTAGLGVWDKNACPKPFSY